MCVQRTPEELRILGARDVAIKDELADGVERGEFEGECSRQTRSSKSSICQRQKQGESITTSCTRQTAAGSSWSSQCFFLFRFSQPERYLGNLYTL